jgi:hypothetical protein
LSEFFRLAGRAARDRGFYKFQASSKVVKICKNLGKQDILDGFWPLLDLFPPGGYNSATI